MYVSFGEIQLLCDIVIIQTLTKQPIDRAKTAGLFAKAAHPVPPKLVPVMMIAPEQKNSWSKLLTSILSTEADSIVKNSAEGMPMRHYSQKALQPFGNGTILASRRKRQID